MPSRPCAYREARPRLVPGTFADLCGLHRTYVGSVERGERNVSLLNIWSISDVLGVRPGQLLDGPTVGTLPAEARVRALDPVIENTVIPEVR